MIMVSTVFQLSYVLQMNILIEYYLIPISNNNKNNKKFYKKKYFKKKPSSLNDKNKNNNSSVNSEFTNNDKNPSMNMISNNLVPSKACLCAKIQMDGKIVRVLVDTGATISCINKTVAEKLGSKLQPSQVSIRSASNHVCRSIGCITVSTGFENVKKDCNFEVFDDKDLSSSCILGMEA
ncbi:hypothetical protein ACTFIW_003867 [Dictyostelium discoideum]